MKKRWKEMGIVLATVCALTVSGSSFVSYAAKDSSGSKTAVQTYTVVTQSGTKVRAVADGTLVSNVLSGDLLKATVHSYNTNMGASKTESDLTYGELKTMTGVLDLSSYSIDSIPAEAFVSCAFREVKFPASLSKIEKKAFADCQSLTVINLPDTLATLESSAFNGCTALVTLNTNNTLPTKLTSVGDNVFAGDTSLENVTLKLQSANAVLKNSTGLFSGCTALKKIVIGTGIDYLPVAAFKNAGSSNEDGVSVTFAKDLKEIMSNAFEGAKFAEDAVIDLSACGSLAGISSDAFNSAQGMTTVVLPKSVTNEVVFGDNAFARTAITTMYADGDKNSDTVYIPDYVTRIGVGCFHYNKAMTKVSITPNVTVLADSLFDYCTELATVEQRVDKSGGCKIQEIGDCAFRGTAISNTDFLLKMNQLTQIGYQKLADSDYSMQKGVWDGVKSRQMQEAEIESLPLGGLKDGDKLVVEDKTTRQKTYNSKPVGSEVFSDCYNLTDIAIPASVTTIGSRAFYFYPRNITNASGGTIVNNSSKTPQVTSINWESGKGEHIIYAGAFHGLTLLQSVTLPYTAGDTLQIGSYAFAWDKTLETIHASGVTGNKLPDSIIGIGKGAFYHCEALPSVQIYDIAGTSTAPTLGDYLFEHCSSMKTATLPAHITVIPAHCFYDVPLTAYYIGENNKGALAQITKIGNLAFLGNQFTTVDLSSYTGLAEIGAGAFAYADCVVEKGEECENSKQQYAKTAVGQLKKVILPDTLNTTVNPSGSLALNTAPFSGQMKMTTLTTNAALKQYTEVTEGVFYVPAYLSVGNARAVFGGAGLMGGTGVTKTIWQVDIDSTASRENLWTTVPMLLYANCHGITDASDVLPKGDYVEKIGAGAFYSAWDLKKADLSQYTKLSAIGSGSLSGNEKAYTGVFAECMNLEEVTFPQSTAEQFTLGEQAFYKADNKELDADNATEQKNADDALKKVDLGNITSMGKNAFTGCRVLETIKLSDRMEEIPEEAFKSCVSLKNVDFANIVTIKDNAFIDCQQLYLDPESTEYQLPATLQTIGISAFQRAGTEGTDGMGTAVIGPNVTEINYSAFSDSGLTKVDFSNAVALTTIYGNAFYNTQLQNFELTGTKVTTLPGRTLAGCSKLTSVKLGDEVETVQDNAIAGCPSLSLFTFAATTYVTSKVFNATIKIGGIEQETNQNVKIEVTTPEKVLLPRDRQEVELPYYIYAKGTSNLKYILIDSADGVTEDSSVKDILKVHAKLNAGYYWHKPESGSQYEIAKDSDYFEALSASRTTKYNNKEVDVITLDTLKAANFRLSVASAMTFSFEKNKNTQTIEFTTTYNIETKELQYKVGLYKEMTPVDGVNTYNNPLTDGENVQKSTGANSGNIQCYYTLEGTKEEVAAIDTYDLVVKTDDPNIVFPAKNSSDKVDKYSTTDGYVISATKVNNSTGKITPQEYMMYFWLVANGIGETNITVYPKGHEAWAQTYRVSVNTDIKSVELEIPEAYRSGAKVGDTFNVFKSYTNLFGTVVDASNKDTLYRTASNRAIVYASSEPEYASVDADGNVTILKADTTDKRVRITATAQNTEGTSCPTNVKEVIIRKSATAGSDTTPGTTTPGSTTTPGATTPGTTPGSTTTTVRTGQTVEDAASGTTAKISKAAENGTGGEVTISKIANANASKVTIPSTIMIDGVPYQVTAISDNLFAGFKKLTAVTLPTSITAIGNGAFQNCKKLKKIVIPKGVQSIGANAFSGCKNLKTITVKTTTLKSVGSNAFKGIHKKAVIKVPKKQYKTYKKLLSNKGQKKSVKIKK